VNEQSAVPALWREKPVPKWIQALPVGKNWPGAMRFGRIRNVRIKLNIA